MEPIYHRPRARNPAAAAAGTRQQRGREGGGRGGGHVGVRDKTGKAWVRGWGECWFGYGKKEQARVGGRGGGHREMRRGPCGRGTEQMGQGDEEGQVAIRKDEE